MPLSQPGSFKAPSGSSCPPAAPSPCPGSAGSQGDISKDSTTAASPLRAVLVFFFLNEFGNTKASYSKCCQVELLHVMRTCVTLSYRPEDQPRAFQGTLGSKSTAGPESSVLHLPFLGTGHQIVPLLPIMKIPKESSSLAPFPQQLREVSAFHSSGRRC